MKLLVIGCGSIGRRHAENFSELVEVGVYDNNVETLASLPFQSFDVLDTALDWKPDAVVVSTPHHTHLEFAEKALHAGAHVLIEKPISHSLEGVAPLITQASLHQKKLYVVCNMRFHSAVETLKHNLSRIGRPLFARAYYGNYLPNMRADADYRLLYAAHREKGGGVVLDAIHELDYLRWFFGPVQSVMAESGKLSDLDIDVEDYAVICLHHQNGVRSEIHLDYLQQCKRRGCEIVGDEGTLIWQSTGKTPEACQVRYYSAKESTWETLYDSDDEQANQAYQQLAERFIQGISETVTDLATADEGLKVLKLALAALASASLGERVELES